MVVIKRCGQQNDCERRKINCGDDVEAAGWEVCSYNSGQTECGHHCDKEADLVGLLSCNQAKYLKCEFDWLTQPRCCFYKRYNISLSNPIQFLNDFSFKEIY